MDQSFHGDEDPIPKNILEPEGKDFHLRMFINCDNDGHKWKKRYRTGLLIYLIMILIDWMSNVKFTCETTVFGAEFVAIKIDMYNMWYKLKIKNERFTHLGSIIYT